MREFLSQLIIHLSCDLSTNLLLDLRVLKSISNLRQRSLLGIEEVPHNEAGTYNPTDERYSATSQPGKNPPYNSTGDFLSQLLPQGSGNLGSNDDGDAAREIGIGFYNVQ